MTQISLDTLSAAIQEASNIEELAVVRKAFMEYAHGRAFIFSEDALEEQRIVNEVHDRMIHRALSLTELKLEGNGMAKPPVRYEYVLFGSGGRKEQTLWSDQDNGIIYDDPHNASEAIFTREYFISLGKHFTEALMKVGYPPCEGEVLSRNERWCRSAHDWEQAVLGWYKEPDWENVRYLLIAADMRCVYGNGRLTERLRRTIVTYPGHEHSVAERLLENTLRHKMLVGIFGQFLKEQYGEGAGGIDIKYGAYIPFINGIRLLAILNKVACSSTVERIQALGKKGVGTPAEVNGWMEAFAFFIRLRARGLYREEDGMWTSSGLLKVGKLTKQEVHVLKSHLKTGKALQRFVKQSVDKYRE